jgi:hypothetical protein
MVADDELNKAARKFVLELFLPGGEDQVGQPLLQGCIHRGCSKHATTLDQNTKLTINHIMSIPDVSRLELNGGTEPSPFPARTKEVAGFVNGTPTDLTSTYFADKILITISQGGRLAQWVGSFELCYGRHLTFLDPSSTEFGVANRVRYRTTIRRFRYASYVASHAKDINGRWRR